MKPQNSLGILLKILTFVAVIGVIALATGIYFYAFMEIVKVLKIIIQGVPKDGEVILKSLKAIDAALLGVIFFIIGSGLFELFIRPVENLPSWFHMKDIDDLKTMLIKVTIVVMGVSFTGRIVTWDGSSDLLGYGIGLGVVIFSLSYFLRVKMKEEE